MSAAVKRALGLFSRPMTLIIHVTQPLLRLLWKAIDWLARHG